MAWRGRGRGRGGFTVARHDIQLSEEEKGSDVPHRFPNPVLGKMPESASKQQLTAEQQRLMIRFERVRMGFRNSPFFMEVGGPAQQRSVEKTVPDVIRYHEPQISDKPQSRRPLHEVITLHDKYIPRELFSEKEERKSARARKVISRTSAKKEVELDLTQLGVDADGEKKDDKEKSDDEKEEGVAEEEDVDDEFDMEDDDYYQGENYDDDEEYGDLDDGGDDEPYF